jgi:putative transposase
MDAVEELTSSVGTARACRALAVSRAGVYRQRRPRPAAAAPPPPRPQPKHALTPQERQQVLEALHSERFVDKAPHEVHATLLDEDTYLCSVRSMYRLLAAAGEVRERRDQLRRPVYTKPELLATGPNQVWSWDITKLKGPVKWTYLYLYVILDIYSRYVVGWLIAHGESAARAKRLIAQTVRKHRIEPGQLALHADRGPSMKSKTLAQLLDDIGVSRSHSRPHVSNDNPYSEAHFKTLKYRPTFPRRFGGLEDARAFCRDFFRWYNTEHRHSGVAFVTPEDVHYGRAAEVIVRRQRVLDEAYRAHPERFINGPPHVPPLPEAVWINPPTRGNSQELAST